MFRQVVSYRWKDGVTDEQKAAFKATFAGLRDIPELIAVRFADDARRFEGNYDVVAVMDFPDFVAARRYVAHDVHQAYIRDYAATMIGERVVVQHDWAVGELVALHHVAVPVSALARSRDWYAAALGLVAVGEGDGESVTMVHPAQPIVVRLCLDAARALAMAGFNAVTFTVGTSDDLTTVIAGLDAGGIAHSEPVESSTCTSVELTDPDGHIIRLRTLLPRT